VRVAGVKPQVGHGLLAALVGADHQRERPRALEPQLRAGALAGEILGADGLEQRGSEHAGPLDLCLRDHRAVLDLGPALGVERTQRDEVGGAIDVAGARTNLRHPVRVEHARVGDGLRRHQQLLPQRPRFVEHPLDPVVTVAGRRADHVRVKRRQRVARQPIPVLHLVLGHLLRHQRPQRPQPLERSERDRRRGWNVGVDLHQLLGIQRRPFVPERLERHRRVLVDLHRHHPLLVHLLRTVLVRHESRFHPDCLASTLLTPNGARARGVAILQQGPRHARGDPRPDDHVVARRSPDPESPPP
jgi:hypothetical protein